MALLKWACASESRYILEDDYDGAFRFNARQILALQGLDSDELEPLKNKTRNVIKA